MFLFKKAPDKELKKTPLYKQITDYTEKYSTLEILLEFARIVQKPSIEEITMDDIKAFYRAYVDPLTATQGTYMHWRHQAMKEVRKFFRAHRGQNILKADWIRDNPLQFVDRIDIVQPMKEEIKKKKGQPRNEEGMKKVTILREEGKLSFREIARAIKKDHRQVLRWYQYVLKDRKLAKRGQLSTG